MHKHSHTGFLYIYEYAHEHIGLYNYFMVSVFGWPDPNTRECCES